jgi:hypothetical protein
MTKGAYRPELRLGARSSGASASITLVIACLRIALRLAVCHC